MIGKSSSRRFGVKSPFSASTAEHNNFKLCGEVVQCIWLCAIWTEDNLENLPVLPAWLLGKC